MTNKTICGHFDRILNTITFVGEACNSGDYCGEFIHSGEHAGQIAVTILEANCDDTYYGCLDYETGNFQVEIPDNCCCPATGGCSTPGFGSGTSGDPYRIRTFEELCLMQGNVSGYWCLCNDIDASDSINLNDGAGWNPTNGVVSFNGFYHVISNLYIKSSSIPYIGFFGINTGTIVNLGLLNSTIISTGNATRVGGFCGENRGTIERCFTKNVDVSGGHWAGYLGGFCGYGLGTIKSCYDSGVVTATTTGTYIGGFIGETRSGSIQNCFSTANVYGNIGSCAVGGFIAKAHTGNYVNCYSSGHVIEGVPAWTGGFCGILHNGVFNNCYYNSENSGRSDTKGGIPKTTAQMKQKNTYTNWLFFPPLEFDDAFWWMTEGVTYPQLLCLAIPETVCEDATEWAENYSYIPDLSVNTENCDCYLCILGHISSNSNRPPTGENWNTYWVCMTE